MFTHMIAFAAGFVLDLIVGDPHWMPHPIRLIGKLIAALDRLFLGERTTSDSARIRSAKKEKGLGLLLVVAVVMLTTMTMTTILHFAYYVNLYLGIAVEAGFTCYVLAMKSLSKESMKVFYCLEDGDTEAARRAVSMIVGRDTDVLDETGIAKAAVETVAENTSDGIIAPLVYTFLGGPIAGMIYKAINTMDSMVGYHNDRYENFGFFAAKLDDYVNYIPSRISALLMIVAALIGGKDYSATEAYRIFKRDRYNHKSPNSAQTESVCAGALGIQLAGDAAYFGKIVEKPYIGDAKRQIEAKDIKRAGKLMYITGFLCFLICTLIGIIFLAVWG